MKTPHRLFNATIVVRRADASVDEHGGPVRAYADSHVLRCRLQVRGGLEGQAFGAERTRYEGRGYCAADADITVADTFTHAGLEYQVTAVFEPDMAGVYRVFDFVRYEG